MLDKMDKKEDLFNRCPHCGSDVEWTIRGKLEPSSSVKYDYSWVCITCPECGASMTVFTGAGEDLTRDGIIEKARKKWNRREGEQKRPTVYISGAISNDPNYKEKFSAVEAKLREMGFDTINPATTDLGEGATYKDYIDHGLAQLMQADMVCRIIPEMKSDGVRVEMHYAEAVGIPIINAIGFEYGMVEIEGKAAV